MMWGSNDTRAALPLMMVAMLAVGAMPVVGADPDASSRIIFLNYDEYVDPQVLADFEEEFGIEVIVETFTDENEMVSMVQADTSRFDLASTSATTLFEMAEQRLVAELDHGNIPNLVNLDARYLDTPANPDSRYGVAYDWGTTGIAYNTDCIEPDEQSWEMLADPRIAGRIAVDPDFTVVIGVALKALGYPLNSSDPAQVDEAIAFVEDLRDDHGLQVVPWDELLDGLAAGELCAGTAYNGDAAVYMDEYDNVGYFVPTEGSDYYIDVLAIPRDAHNKAGAEAFINYMLRPDVHAANNEFTGYAVPNRASIEGGHVAAESLADQVRYPEVENLEPWEPFDAERRQLWNRAWAEFERSGA